jgi:hypothetical protein
MPNVDEVFGGDALKASDLKGKDVTLTIHSVSVVKFDDGAKLKLLFERTNKYLIVNKTNAARIKMMHGADTDRWPGCKITIYAELVPFQGREDWAIRVRVKQQEPQPAAVDPNEGFDQYDDRVPF